MKAGVSWKYFISLEIEKYPHDLKLIDIALSFVYKIILIHLKADIHVFSF